MGKNIRKDLKRQCAQSVNHLGAVVLDQSDLYNAFKEQHPDIAEKFAQVAHNAMECRKAILLIASEAWGFDEERLMNYL